MQSRILIVEDEKKIADTLSFGLGENSYVVDNAYEGITALELFETRQYDLIVLDVNLPGINGYELCKIIRSKNIQIPVIILTAYTSLNNKIEGYKAGADDYITKPFEFKELLMKIGVILKRTINRNLTAGNVLKAGNLEINLDTREVKRGEALINLSTKEFNLLEYLMRNKNRVVSRADIALHVWNIDFDTNTNGIDVYISYIRNKVDKPFKEKLIQTHFGSGYILKENG